jgi:hypothetical protein
MLSESQQKRVWEGMLSAEIRSNYFAELSAGYLRRQRASTWITLLFSSGAAISILSNLGDELKWIQLVLTLVAAGVSAYSLVMQNQKFALDASDLHARWNRAAKDFEAIWEDVYADDAAERLNAVDERTTDLSKAGASFPYSRRKMLHWQEHVERHRVARA